MICMRIFKMHAFVLFFEYKKYNIANSPDQYSAVSHII